MAAWTRFSALAFSLILAAAVSAQAANQCADLFQPSTPSSLKFSSLIQDGEWKLQVLEFNNNPSYQYRQPLLLVPHGARSLLERILLPLTAVISEHEFRNLLINLLGTGIVYQNIFVGGYRDVASLTQRLIESGEFLNENFAASLTMELANVEYASQREISTILKTDLNVRRFRKSLSEVIEDLRSGDAPAVHSALLRAEEILIPVFYRPVEERAAFTANLLGESNPILARINSQWRDSEYVRALLLTHQSESGPNRYKGVIELLERVRALPKARLSENE